MLTGRRAEILGLVVSEYIDTAAPVSSRALVDRHHLQVSTATIRNELARLEEEGYIRREDGARDKRLNRIFLTARGRRFFERKMQLRLAFLGRMLAGIPQREVEQMQATLQRILDNVRDTAADAAHFRHPQHAVHEHRVQRHLEGEPDEIQRHDDAWTRNRGAEAVEHAKKQHGRHAP